MSEAIRCNRCGECFDPNELKYDAVRFTNPVVYDGENYRKTKIKGYMVKLLKETPYFDDRIDLCPKCTWYFKKFMAGYNFMIQLDPDDDWNEFIEGFPAGISEFGNDSQEKQG